MPAKKDETKVVEEKVEATEAKAEKVVKEKKTTKKTVKKAEKEDKTEKKVEKKKTVKKETKKEEKVEKKVEKSTAKGKTDKKHGQYFEGVEVKCICGAITMINSTIPGPIRVETCHECHPIYNKDKVIKKVIKGRMEKFLEKQKRMESMKG